MKNSFTNYIILLIILEFYLRSFIYSQISVAPVTLHLNEKTRTGFFIVENLSEEKKEIEIELNFGYPVSDDSGNVYVQMFNPDSTCTYSAVKWIRIYPRIFVLNPKEYQTVRLVVRPPIDLPEGEYWARPSISSRSVIQAEKTGSTERQVKLTMEMKIFISLNYRNGKIETGVDIKSLKARKDKNKIYILADLERKGNAAFLGNIVSRIKDKEGKVRKEIFQEIAVYRDILKKIEMDVADINLNQSVLEVELNTNRQEPGEIIIKSKSESRTINLP